MSIKANHFNDIHAHGENGLLKVSEFYMFGGKTKSSIKVYNTCAKSCELLLDMGIKSMKIWPFDGLEISNYGV